MANIIKIDKLDFCNGPGSRVSIWFAGCEFHCEGCHNPHTWNFNQGEQFNASVMQTIKQYLERGFVKDLSILGGEPLHPKNLETSTKICKEVKEWNSNINIWLWTGYEFDEIKDLEIIRYLDAIKCGKYIKEKHCKHKYFGSDNQYIVYLKNGEKERKETYEHQSN